MGIVRWLRERSYVDGESAEARSRKDLVVPMYCVAGAFGLLGAILSTPSSDDFHHESVKVRVSRTVRYAAGLVIGITLLASGMYIVGTKRISTRLCEVPVLICAGAVIVFDAATSLQTVWGVLFANVVVLDCLLVCKCSATAARAVVAATTLSMLARSFVDAGDVSGSCGSYCEYDPGTPRYFVRALVSFFTQAVVFVVDFHFTRGFATSMTEQTALVEASVRVSEAAAVLLSRYETEATQELLEGDDGARLPPMLRAAMQQLVTNLALYRPYLPQSCLPDGGDVERSTSEGRDEGEPVRALSSCDETSAVSAGSRGSSLSVQRVGDVAGLLRLQSQGASNRKASVIAVNSQKFLSGRSDKEGVVNAEVAEFIRAVGSERGVVDLVSGDHLFANFNASRMCTSHRGSAARTVWEMAGNRSPESVQRTAAACSAVVLCGDLGTPELRRFMLLGAVFNTLQCLERVAAQLGAVLIDETVGSDADVAVGFFTALIERMIYPKRGEKPFFVWQVNGVRAVGASGPDEWLYELERLAPSPHDDWNRIVQAWLFFGEPVPEDLLERIEKPYAAEALTRRREPTYLREAGVTGGSVLFASTPGREVG